MITEGGLDQGRMIYAEGANYRFEIADTIATCRVWRRPDLDSNAGARCAQETIEHFRALALAGSNVARAIILDVSDAPAVAGPRTLQAIGQLLEAWELVKRPVAVVIGAAPIQALQFRRLIVEYAATCGAMFYDVESALSWAVQQKPSRSAQR